MPEVDGDSMSKLPLRLFGFCLLAASLSLASCQAAWHSVSNTVAPLVIDHDRD
jgi:hypothetical protein